MSRKRPDAIKPIKDLEECNQLLNTVGELNRSISLIECEMNEKIDQIKETAERKSYAFKVSLSEIESRLQGYAEYNQSDLFKTKRSIELLHGIFGFRISTKLKQAKGFKVQDTLEKIKEFNWLEAIRIGKEGLNKDILNDWTDEKLESVGQQRVIQDVFWYEVKEEDL